MDQGDIARIGVVGMGVDVVRFAVCRPTGVGDADRSVQILGFDEMFQIGDFALAFEHVQNSFPIDQCESCAVVTAIFQAVKSFYQNGVSLPFTHVTYNSTHNVFFLRFAKIVKAGRKREFVLNFPRRILSKTMSKIVKGKSNRANLHAKIAEPNPIFYKNSAR